MNGYATPQLRPQTDANANPVKNMEPSPEGGVSTGARAKIVIEDPVKPDVVCTVQSTPPQPFSSRSHRWENDEQKKAEHTSQVSEPKSTTKAEGGSTVQPQTQASIQQQQQHTVDPQMNLQLAMLDNQLRNILKTGREESQASPTLSDRPKYKDSAAGDHPQAAMLGAGQHILSPTPLMNGTLDGAILANLAHEEGDGEQAGASKDNNKDLLHPVVRAGAMDYNDETHEVNEEYQAEKEVSVQKPEEMMKAEDRGSPRKESRLIHQSSLPGLEEEQEEVEDGEKRVVLTGVTVEFTPRHNSIMFGGVDERSQTYLPGGEYAQCTSVYVDENATRMAPYTMATQFNVSMASSEEESDGEGDGKWDVARPGSFAFSPAGSEKHRQRSIHNLQQAAVDGDDRSGSSRGDRRHSVPKSVQLKDDDGMRPEQTGHVMSRSADAYMINANNNADPEITDDFQIKEHMFKSSSSHSSLKDYQNVLEIPLGKVSPFKSLKLRKDVIEKRDKRSSPKRDILLKRRSKDCDSDKASEKSTSDKDGDHLIIDELENEKTHVVTTPCVEGTDMRGFETPAAKLDLYRKGQSFEGSTESKQKTTPETERLLHDPVLEKLRSLSSGTYLPKSFSETSLRYSQQQVRGGSRSEVPSSDTGFVESKYKSLSDVRTFKKENLGGFTSGPVRLGSLSQPNLIKMDSKALDQTVNNVDANDSQSTSTERVKSDLQAKEIKSLPLGTEPGQNEGQSEERGSADGESPRQVLSEGNVATSTLKTQPSASIPKHKPAPTETQTDLRKCFAEKVSLKLTSIKQTEKAAAIADELDSGHISKDKFKLDWDSSSHSMTDSGRVDSGRDPEDYEVQSLNRPRSSRDGRVDSVPLSEGQDSGIPRPRPPKAPAPRMGSKVMAAR